MGAMRFLISPFTQFQIFFWSGLHQISDRSTPKMQGISPKLLHYVMRYGNINCRDQFLPLALEKCVRGLLGGSLILVNLGNDHELISKEYISFGTRPFEETQRSHEDLCSKCTISYHFGES